MKSLGAIVIFVSLLLAYHVIGRVWGIKAKVVFAIGIIVVYSVVAVVTLVMRRRLSNIFKNMEADTLKRLLAEHPEIIEELSPSPAIDWKWKLLDMVLGICFTVGPVLLVSIEMKQPLSLESKFTGYHLLAMAGGLGVYWLGRTTAIKLWRHK